jgi:hypothetical protein
MRKDVLLFKKKKKERRTFLLLLFFFKKKKARKKDNRGSRSTGEVNGLDRFGTKTKTRVRLGKYNWAA